jgi:hypothetical protein
MVKAPLRTLLLAWFVYFALGRDYDMLDGRFSFVDAY